MNVQFPPTNSFPNTIKFPDSRFCFSDSEIAKPTEVINSAKELFSIMPSLGKRLEFVNLGDYHAAISTILKSLLQFTDRTCSSNVTSCENHFKEDSNCCSRVDFASNVNRFTDKEEDEHNTFSNTDLNILDDSSEDISVKNPNYKEGEIFFQASGFGDFVEESLNISVVDSDGQEHLLPLDATYKDVKLRVVLPSSPEEDCYEQIDLEGYSNDLDMLHEEALESERVNAYQLYFRKFFKGSNELVGQAQFTLVSDDFLSEEDKYYGITELETKDTV